MISLEEYRERNPRMSGEPHNSYDRKTYRDWRRSSLEELRNTVDSGNDIYYVVLRGLIDILEAENE